MELDYEDPGANDETLLSYGRKILLAEGEAVVNAGRRLDRGFARAVRLIYASEGSVIVTGMGKAGLIGKKIMATLGSTGTRAHYLHPAEAVHGDLGRVHEDDVVLVLSQSGETEEVVRLLPVLERWRIPVIAITARADSTLGGAATITLPLGELREADALGLAPSTSTTVMLAVGDALALAVSRLRDFRREDFARFHPGGSLGKKLSQVDEVMRPLAQCRVASDTLTVKDVLVVSSLPGRRTGAVMLVDAAGRLSGIFTDSDLVRLLEGRPSTELQEPIEHVMTRNPRRVLAGTLTADALEIISGRKISELPVVDSAGRPVGMIDITDVLSLLPKDTVKAAEPASRAAA